MPQHNSILAVDAGNSRVKWAMHQNAAFIHEGWCENGQLDRLEGQWSQLTKPDAVVIANVAGEEIGARLVQCCEQWNVSPTWVKGLAHQCGVTNCYDDPQQLGPDRWAALIGAHALAAGNCVVVCLGTATTIDALTSEGLFLGGLILPGIDMMHAALADRTARLGAERGEPVAFPRCTRDAISAGAFGATCGAIEAMVGQMQRAGHENVGVLSTGGAAAMFDDVCARPMSRHDKLVLQGLVCISQNATGQTDA